MNMLKRTSVGCALLMLGGCATNLPVGVIEPTFGDAVGKNIAGQIVNPMAPQDRGPLTMDGRRAALQQQRYITDMVEPPVDISTQQSQSGGGGGGGGGAGGSSAGAGAAAR
jgi:uncharacterized membrane protein YgcG